MRVAIALLFTVSYSYAQGTRADYESWYDFHTTILHLLGIDHERLTFYHNGIQRRLTNVHGHVVKDVLA